MGQLSEYRPRYFTLVEQGDVVVVTFAMSHISDEDNIEELGYELFGLVEQYESRKVVLCMGAVEYVTSSVIGKLITLHRKLHRCNGQLVICELTQGVAEVLQAARLMNYFTVMDKSAAAVASLKSNA